MSSIAPSSAAESVRILVVDDNAPARYATARVLRSAGYQVLEAASGTAALQAARQVALVVLDINLPDIDGFDVCRRLRADPATAHLPVLHLSATFIQHADFLLGLKAGADSYLTRPVEPPVLIATVRALLFARQAEIVRHGLNARLRELFELTPVAMATLDAEMRLATVNPAFSALSGYAGQELVGQPAAMLLQGSAFGAETGAEVGGDAVVPGARGRGCGVLRRCDGSLAQVEWQLARKSSSGTRLLTLTDVTTRVQAETEREALLARERAARAEAERSNRLKEEFLATLSHELRTPLSAILGWSTVLGRMGDLPPTVVQGVQAIERNSRVQAQMISDLLDYAGIAYGKLRLATAVIDPLPVVRAALEVVHSAAQAAGVTIRSTLEPAGFVEADPGRLQQMVWNLLSNAIKFSQRGGVVELSAGPADGRVRIGVRDHGEGIAAQFLPHIFERFSQQDASSTRRHGGLGLGLAIVKQLAEVHGGAITAHSEGEGRGATFTLELPLTLCRPHEVRGDEAREPLPDLHGIVVLLVEDDLDARALARRILIDAGAQVVEAASTAEALPAVVAGGIHVLVSDIGMAGEDGYALVRQLRAGGHGPRELPAIALTAFARARDRDDALAAGFQDHLVKPFEAQALVRRIAALHAAARRAADTQAVPG